MVEFALSGILKFQIIHSMTNTKKVIQTQNSYRFSDSTFRCGGYALLALAMIDFINIFIPSHFTNPFWEFQTIGALVDHVPIPLIGLMLIFVGEMNYREKIEIFVLKFCSWLSLIIALLFILLVPLGISDTLRINEQNHIQIINQSSQQISQIEQLKEILNKAKTDQDIENVFHALNHQEKLPDFKNPQDIKSKLLAQVTKTDNNIKNQTEVTQNKTRRELIRNSVKWNLGAIIAGTAFIFVWRTTEWARLN